MCIRDSKGGGVLIYARSQLNCTIYETHDYLETLWVRGSIPHTNSAFFVNASYHPPKHNHSNLDSYLANTASLIMSQYPHTSLFIGGDFNKLKLNQLLDGGLIILPTPPTRGDATLDLLLTNRRDLVDNTTTVSYTHLTLPTILLV